MSHINDYLKNIRVGRPPLTTPLRAEATNDQLGVPFSDRVDTTTNQAPAPAQQLDETWAAWFHHVGVRIADLPMQIDTHANRILATNPAPAVAPPPYSVDRYLGMLFFETDRTVVYASRLVSNLATWVYVAGQMVAALASRPSDLGVNDAGFLFFASDTLTIYEWTGTVWKSYGGSVAATDFIPASDGGASLGRQTPSLRRFLNLYLSGQLGVGMAGALIANYIADLRSSTATAVAHVAAGDVDSGLYMLDSGVGAVAYNAVFDGSNWIAKASTALILQLSPSSGLLVCADTGLTIGSAYTPTQLFTIGTTGAITGANLHVTGVTSSGNMNSVSGGYQVAGTQVVTSRQATVTAPSGGTTVDTQARTAISALISRLQTHGLIS